MKFTPAKWIGRYGNPRSGKARVGRKCLGFFAENWVKVRFFYGIKSFDFDADVAREKEDLKTRMTRPSRDETSFSSC